MLIHGLDFGKIKIGLNLIPILYWTWRYVRQNRSISLTVGDFEKSETTEHNQSGIGSNYLKRIINQHESGLTLFPDVSEIHFRYRHDITLKARRR